MKPFAIFEKNRMIKERFDYARRYFGNLQDYFFPKNCLNCHAEGTWLCESCSDSLFFIDKDIGFCPFCGIVGDLFGVCPKCREKTGIKKVFSLFKYRDSLARKIIKNFKYNYLADVVSDLEPPLRRFLLKYGGLLGCDGAVLLPVPLSAFKFAERGFNQAEELAKTIGNILNLPVSTDIVKKIRRTKNQVEIDRAERTKNLAGAFRIQKSPPKRVLIVDDVFTTGSTVREIAGALRASGTENIQVITLARG